MKGLEMLILVNDRKTKATIPCLVTRKYGLEPGNKVSLRLNPEGNAVYFLNGMLTGDTEFKIYTVDKSGNFIAQIRKDA